MYILLFIKGRGCQSSRNTWHVETKNDLLTNINVTVFVRYFIFKIILEKINQNHSQFIGNKYKLICFQELFDDTLEPNLLSMFMVKEN